MRNLSNGVVSEQHQPTLFSEPNASVPLGVQIPDNAPAGGACGAAAEAAARGGGKWRKEAARPLVHRSLFVPKNEAERAEYEAGRAAAEAEAAHARAVPREVGRGAAFSYERTLKNLCDMGAATRPEALRVAFPDARNLLCNCLSAQMPRGVKLSWLPEYERVAGWMAGNAGRGLCLRGDCGRGKSLIGLRVLPVVFYHFYRLVVHCCAACELNGNPSAVLSQRLLYIDDVGTEGVLNDFGTRRVVFSEIVDAMERRGGLLMFSTNLSRAELVVKYGERTVDRLFALCALVDFKGESFRRNGCAG